MTNARTAVLPPFHAPRKGAWPVILLRILLAGGSLPLASCGGIDLDPTDHRQLPRTSLGDSRPPADLLNGTAK